MSSESSAGAVPKPEVSVILPCLNEEKTLGRCIAKARQALDAQGIRAEIIVVDNGSSDRSRDIAHEHGVRVVDQPVRGYGAAYLKGLAEAEAEVIAMGDADNTYDFAELPKLLTALGDNTDLVLGSRFMGGMARGVMPAANRYIGNPMLTGMLNLFFGARVSDAHSGLRVFRRRLVEKMELRATGMEFASEMIVAALREGARIREVPIIYHPREGESKLKPMSDAWRHVRFMLLFSPDWLFLIPGLLLFCGGLVALLLTGWGKLTIAGHRFDTHAMIFFTFFSLLGYQIVSIGAFAKTYALNEGFIKEDRILQALWRVFDLEKGLVAGLTFFVLGTFGAGYIVYRWVEAGFGSLNLVKVGLVGLLFMVVGAQTVFSSFFLSLLGIQRRPGAMVRQ